MTPHNFTLYCYRLANLSTVNHYDVAVVHNVRYRVQAVYYTEDCHNHYLSIEGLGGIYNIDLNFVSALVNYALLRD